jgi:pimeloyl-ACP methyl ester carboxylesterase
MPRRARVVSALVLIAAVISPALAAAQDVPVVFVHGLASDGSAWQAASESLQQQLALEPHQPTQSWFESYQTQASQLHSTAGALAAETIAVGHSNGGIVSREWSKLKPLAGVVTLGTPNQGAPLAHNLLDWIGFNHTLANRIDSVFGGFSECIAYGCGWEWVIFQGSLDQLLVAIYEAITQSIVGLTTTVGIQLGAPVLPQMSPGSAVIAELNSPGNLTREASAISSRVGIVSVARNWFDAGWYRALNPESADTVDAWKDAAVFLLDWGSSYLYGIAGPTDYLALDVAAFMSAAAGRIDALDWQWCATVSHVGAGECHPNDTIVPDWSQVYPGAAIVHTGVEGPVHTRETTESGLWLYQVLTNYMSIPPRSGGGSGGTGGGSSFMQADSAVVGCSDWWWWDPAPQPDADTCYSYCAQNGAQACEWYANGDCYVEFGRGCSVLGGYSGWSAAVLSDGGSGSGGGGTGGGGNSMQADSAVVGCSNWFWWDPVQQPDANACHSYCTQNGAQACEWHAGGGCYVEFGSGCSVQAGYPGWSASVLNDGSGSGSSSGGLMQTNSAIVGCSDWYWWNPVQQPDADACHSYCTQNGAQACEWYANGDCYVEFGNGCSVQGGYPGWSAAVLR